MKPIIIKKLLAVAVLLISIKLTAQPVTVTLRANYSYTASVYHDEPLLLIVSLTNEEAQENSRWNKAADRGLEGLEELLKAGKIKKEDYDREKARLMLGKKPVSSVTIGTTGKPWSSLLTWQMINTSNQSEVSLMVRTMTNPGSEAVAVLDQSGYYTAYFGIDDAEMKNIPAGVYTVRVSIGGQTSDPVRLEIKKETIPAVLTDTESMLLMLGQYNWHAGEIVKGMQYANRLLQKNPVSLDGLSLKGDLQVLGNEYAAALITYNQAAKEYYKQNGAGAEPPEYLLKMIAWLKEQLGG